MKWLCLRCRAINAMGAHYCHNCGAVGSDERMSDCPRKKPGCGWGGVMKRLLCWLLGICPKCEQVMCSCPIPCPKCEGPTKRGFFMATDDREFLPDAIKCEACQWVWEV